MWCVCVCALTCKWTLTSVHWCFKSAATPGRSETCGCVALCQLAVCVFLNMCLYVCVFSYPHLYRRHTAAPLTPASLFVLQFSLIFPLCGRHVHFSVVTHTHTFAVTLVLKLICTHFCIHTGAGPHVLNLICARTALCPFVIAATFAWEGTCVQFHIFTDIFTVSRCDYESKFAFSMICLLCPQKDNSCHVSLWFF